MGAIRPLRQTQKLLGESRKIISVSLNVLAPYLERDWLRSFTQHSLKNHERYGNAHP